MTMTNPAPFKQGPIGKKLAQQLEREPQGPVIDLPHALFGLMRMQDFQTRNAAL